MTDLFDGSGDVPREKLSAYFDELSLKCQDLQKYVSGSVHFLTAYNLGQYQQVVFVWVYEYVDMFNDIFAASSSAPTSGISKARRAYA